MATKSENPIDPLKRNAVHSPVELLGMETALLIATAPSREINISIWFNEHQNEGKIPIQEFDSKMASLANTMSINQDEETKQELELAISPLALKTVHRICSIGTDDKGQALIDISYFFKLCQEKVDKYLSEMGGEDGDEEDDDDSEAEDIEENQPNFREWKEGAYDIEGNLIEPATKPEPKSEQKADYDIIHLSADEYITDLKSKASGPRPISAPPGKRGTDRGETVDEIMRNSNDEVDHASSTKPALPITSPFNIQLLTPEKPSDESKYGPNSPYDELYDVPEDNDDDVDSGYYRTRSHAHQAISPVINRFMPDSPNENIDWNAENRHFLMVSSPSKQDVKPSGKPAPKSSTSPARPVRGGGQHTTAINHPSQASKPRPRSAGPRMRHEQKTTVPSSTTNAVTAIKQLRSKSAERVRPTLSSHEPTATLKPTEETKPQMKKRHSFSGIPSRKSGSSLPPYNPLNPRISVESLTEGQEHYLKDIVEDLIRNIVKQTDLYHIIQVSFGFVNDYTLIPARGSIIQSKAKDWITDSEIVDTFLRARLLLNTTQVSILKLLFEDFVNNYTKLYPNNHLNNTTTNTFISKKETKLDEDDEHKKRNLLDLPAKGPKDTLNAEWLRKYLVHLRLSKRNQSYQSNKTLLPAPLLNSTNEDKFLLAHRLTIDSKKLLHGKTPGQIGQSTQEPHEQSPSDELQPPNDATPQLTSTNPLPWKDWLVKKIKQQSKLPQSNKSKELEKALQGKKHHLTLDDIEYLLKTNTILPHEILMQEIEYRIESWILDMDGRRDFQHQLNIKIRNYIWENMILLRNPPANLQATVPTGNPKIPKTESGYWKLWNKIPEEEHETIKNNLFHQLIYEKREEMKTIERTKHMITKELYKKYQTYLQERHEEITWAQWLTQYLTNQQKILDKFQSNEQKRKQMSITQKLRKKSMASISSIEETIHELSQGFDLDHQLQIKKGLVTLRKLTQDKGLGHGNIVAKEDFDAIIRPLLTPYVNLNDTFIENATEPPADNPLANPDAVRFNEDWKKKLNDLFTSNPQETIQRVMNDHEQLENKNRKSYDAWLDEKKRVKSEEEKKKLEAKEKEESNKKIKEKQNMKAYKKWLKLRRQNKYKSMVDNKYREIPTLRQAEHDSRWNNDKEVIHSMNDDEENNIHQDIHELHRRSFSNPTSSSLPNPTPVTLLNSQSSLPIQSNYINNMNNNNNTTATKKSLTLKKKSLSGKNPVSSSSSGGAMVATPSSSTASSTNKKSVTIAITTNKSTHKTTSNKPISSSTSTPSASSRPSSANQKKPLPKKKSSVK